MEGVAPGIYNLYAEAAGYPQTLIASGVQVLRGQSLHYDGYLQPGAVIHGNVYTKHQFGDEPWPAYEYGNGVVKQYIKIELYDGPTLSNKVDPSANMVTWSPIPCVAGGQKPTFYGPSAGNGPWNTFYDDSPKGGYSITQANDAKKCGEADLASPIAFPWGGYNTLNGYSAVQLSQPNSPTTNNQDPLGVGPPQQWVVPSGTTTPFQLRIRRQR